MKIKKVFAISLVIFILVIANILAFGFLFNPSTNPTDQLTNGTIIKKDNSDSNIVIIDNSSATETTNSSPPQTIEQPAVQNTSTPVQEQTPVNQTQTTTVNRPSRPIRTAAS
jgi:hypothetical protein